MNQSRKRIAILAVICLSILLSTGVYADSSGSTSSATSTSGSSSSSSSSGSHTDMGTSTTTTGSPTVTATATTTASKITVTFSAKNNGSEITGYTIALYDSTGRQLDEQTATEAGSVSFTEVSHQTTYTIDVSATNAYGTSTETITVTTDTNGLIPYATLKETQNGDYNAELTVEVIIEPTIAGYAVEHIINNNSTLTIVCSVTSDIISQLNESNIAYELDGSYGLDYESTISVNGDTATAIFTLKSPFGELTEEDTAEAQKIIDEAYDGSYYFSVVTATASLTADQFEAIGVSNDIPYSVEVSVAPYTFNDGGTVSVTPYDPYEGWHKDGAATSNTHTSSSTTKDNTNDDGDSSTSTNATTTTSENTPFVNPFTDISEEHYYYAPIVWAAENGIASGISDTEFSPDSVCTRAQAITFLWRAAGSPEVSGENPFADMSEDDYYYTAVLWALENGITTGISDTAFSPDATCTRAEIVTFLYRASAETAEAGDTFADVSANAWYSSAISWAVAGEITTGTGDNQFSPDSPCTRGQIVTFLYRDMV